MKLGGSLVSVGVWLGACGGRYQARANEEHERMLSLGSALVEAYMVLESRWSAMFVNGRETLGKISKC